MLNKIMMGITLCILSIAGYGLEIYPEVVGGVTFHKHQDESFAKNEMLISIDDTAAKLAIDYEEALLNSYEQELADTELEYSKEQELYDRLATSQKNLDKARLAFIYAQNQVKIQQAKVAIAQHMLSKYQIKAPFAGKVTSITPLNAVNENFAGSLMVVEKSQ